MSQIRIPSPDPSPSSEPREAEPARIWVDASLVCGYSHQVMQQTKNDRENIDENSQIKRWVKIGRQIHEQEKKIHEQESNWTKK